MFWKKQKNKNKNNKGDEDSCCDNSLVIAFEKSLPKETITQFKNAILSKSWTG